LQFYNCSFQPGLLTCKEKNSVYIFIKIDEEYFRIIPRVTIVNVMQLRTNVRPNIDLRQQNTLFPDIKQSLLLQYPSLTAEKSSGELDRSVISYWIIVPLLGRRWFQSDIYRTELDPPRLWTLFVLNCL
jgi:hypothetical protein